MKMLTSPKRRRCRTRLSLESLEARRLLVGELIELQLDAVQGGTSIVDENRTVHLNSGDEFELRVQYDDLRQGFEKKGAFQLLADVAVSQPQTVVPLMHQVEKFVIPSDATAIEFAYDGKTVTDNEDGMITPLDFLRAFDEFGITNAEIDFAGAGGSLSVELSYSEPEDVNTNFPFIEITTTDANGNNIENEVTRIAPRLSDGSLNPDALITSLNLSSPSLGGREVYSDLLQGTYNIDSMTDTMQQVGGIVPVFSGDLLIENLLPDPFVAYGIRMRVVGSGSNINFSLSSADNPESVLLFGLDEPVPESKILIDRDAAFVANFGASIAVDDTASLDEDTIASISVLDNDSGDDLVIDSVGAPSNGTVAISGGMVNYSPNADFNGTDVFTYTVSDQFGGKSTARVVVTVNPVNDAPIAFDDTFSSIDPSERLFFTPADLLVNDSPGPDDESDQTLTVTLPASTVAGGVLTVDDAGNFSYTPPAGLIGTDSFDYEVSDGELMSQATVELGVAYSLLPVYVSLPENIANDVTLRVDGADIVVLDNIAEIEIFRRPLEPTEDIHVEGSSANADRITVDHRFGSVFRQGNASGGPSRAIHIFAGTSADDEVVLLLDAEYVVQSFEQISDSSLSRNHFLNDVESVSVIQSSDHFLGLGEGLVLNTGQTLSIGNFYPSSVNGSLNLEGGVLNATPGGVYIPGGAVLQGDGTVNGRIIGAIGSTIAAEDGDLMLGDATSVVGFETAGDVRVGDHQLTLLDANQAVLGGLTTIGTSNIDGMLVSAGGLVIDFGGNVIGNGVIDTVNSSSTPIINNGLIQGIGDEPSLSLTGLIKGVGRLDNVTIDGTASPGFSPTISRFGNIAFSDVSKLLIELGGSQAGSGYDQILIDGWATIDGIIDVQFIDNFVASAGQWFDVLQATDLLGISLDKLQLPELGEGLDWIVDQTPQSLTLTVGINVNETGDEVEISIKEGDLVVKDSDGREIPLEGSTVTLIVDPMDEFDSADDWYLAATDVENGTFTQRATNGDFELVIEGSRWKNFVRATDVDLSGGTSARDALVIINQLTRQQFTEDSSNVLLDPEVVEEFPGFLFDVSGDGLLTALDALRVVNQIAFEVQFSSDSEGESVGFLLSSESFSSNMDSALVTTIESFDQPAKSQSFSEANVDAVFTMSDLWNSSEEQDLDETIADEFRWVELDQLELSLASILSF